MVTNKEHTMMITKCKYLAHQLILNGSELALQWVSHHNGVERKEAWHTCKEGIICMDQPLNFESAKRFWIKKGIVIDHFTSPLQSSSESKQLPASEPQLSSETSASNQLDQNAMEVAEVINN